MSIIGITHNNPSIKNNFRNQILLLSTILINGILFSINLLSIIRRYAVNIIFWDQFDFMYPIIKNGNVWSLFTFQHGPHRQGLGELAIWVTTRLSGWNTRMDSYAIFFVLILCTMLAIYIKFRLIGKFQWIDICIPAIFLNQKQWEQLILTPNISHSALPLFLILLLSSFFFLKNDWTRILLQLFAIFLCVFTGFGIFSGVSMGLVYGIDFIGNLKSHPRNDAFFPNLLGLLGILIIYSLFFCNYKFDPSADCFGFQWNYLYQYPIFIRIMVSKFFGLNSSPFGNISAIIGAVILVVMIYLFIQAMRILYSNLNPKDDTKNRITVFLAFFFFLFIISTAIGRICFGINAGQASRYMTLVAPGIYIILIWAGTIELPIRSEVMKFLIISVLLIPSALCFSANDLWTIRYFTHGKVKWRECYLNNLDIGYCNQKTGFKIYPNQKEQIQIELDYLKGNHYNLFN